VDVRLLLAHHYLRFQVQHADDPLALVADALAVVARVFPAYPALAVDLVPWNQGPADIALPKLVHRLTGPILSEKHLGQRRSSTTSCKHFPHVFLQHLLQTPSPW
jgi:hypothetical protein